MNTIFDIANWFLANIDREAGDTISHLKLQKLVYYAQAWYLALYDKAIFENDFQAWAHGPANPELYDKYKDYGHEQIPDTEDDINVNANLYDFLLNVLDIYGKYSAKYLESLTHSETPWIQTRGNLPEGAYCDSIIEKDLMKKYYREKYEKEKKGGKK